MSLIAGYPEGSDISILNASYHYAVKNPNTGKYFKDFMVLSYKDNITKQKNHQIIYEPTYEFYKANDNIQLEYNRLYIEKEKVHLVECKYSDLEKTIAEMTGNLDFFYENINSGNRRANRALHTIPSIFGSDANIEDHYRARFARAYKNEVYPVDKAYFDIEVDTKYMRGDFPEMGECPVNAVSYIDDKTHTINVFLLRNENNPLIQEFEENLYTDEKMIALFNELQELYNGKSLVQDGAFALEVMKYINEKIQKFKKEDNILYAIYGTPAESLCGTQVEQFRKKYGIVKGVSDREYVSNSFHCAVWEDISGIQKQDLEGRFWDLFRGGRIQYVRYNLNYNDKAMRTYVERAMDKGFYEGVNLALSYCNNCGHQELDMDVCPKCGSSDLTKIDRMNGYLSYSRVHGDTRLNKAKMAEIAERKSM